MGSKQRYVQLGGIARGGMATVYRVHDTLLQRTLAMKVLDPTRAQDPAEVERFIEEAQVTAQLEHPYIPAVHEIGVTPDGRQYFTLKLVNGRTLDRILDEVPGPTEDKLYPQIQVYLKVCEAVAFAHSRGVIHCDIKPENVMVGSHGQVYLMDWGIARVPVDRLDGPVPVHPVFVERALPRKDVAGTLGYLSPEQAKSKPEQIDERSDVFSLGALLYRMVVGTTIYPLEPRKDAMARAMFAEVTAPQEAAPGRALPKRLCAIALRALSAKKEDRYLSVNELRRDVEDWARGLGRHPLKTYAAGEVILTEGEPGHTAYVIKRGKVDVYKLIHGRKQPLVELGQGEIFGEAAIFSARGRTASVSALEETTVIEISREALEEELSGTVVIRDLVRVLAQRFSELDAQARKLRERVDDWALHSTVMTHFALHGTTLPDASHSARWSSLRQVLVKYLNVPDAVVAEWVAGVKGVRLDEANDLVLLGVSLKPQEPMRVPTLPEFTVPPAV